MSNLAWLNGNISELDDAKIGVQDRGFLFGDGVYDVIKIYNSKPFRLSAHLDRLQRSSLAIKIDIPHSKKEIENITKNLIEKSKCSDGFIYMQVTRGYAPRDHFFPTGVTPTLLIYVLDIGFPPAKKDVKPIKCIALPDERWVNCHIKSTNLLPNILAIQKAKEAGAGEAILHRPDGMVTEGTRTNIFAVIDNNVRTHPESTLILAGITRSIAVDIIRNSDTPFFEEAFNLEDLKKATEVWTTSTGLEITPVQSVDEHIINGAVPGPVCHYLTKEFWKIVNAECYS